MLYVRVTVLVARQMRIRRLHYKKKSNFVHFHFGLLISYAVADCHVLLSEGNTLSISRYKSYCFLRGN
jgi:hypothetical protein